jgi:uncharacterized protein (DUF362 family)
MSTWVQPGDRVVIKPNCAYSEPVSQGSNVHPQAIAALLDMCQAAGAGEIRVVEHTLDGAAIVFDESGLGEVCSAAGVPLLSLEHESMYREVEFSQGRQLSQDKIAREVLDADVYINVALPKVHDAAGATLTLKNQMGAIFDRLNYHRVGSLAQNIVDLGLALRPTLNVVEASRALLTAGPRGPGRVENPEAVVVGVDPVAVDAYACRWLEIAPEEVEHLRLAAAQGLGTMELSSLRVLEV